MCFFVIESNPRLTLGTFPHSVQVGSIWGAAFKVADDHVVCSGGGSTTLQWGQVRVSSGLP